MNLNEVLQLHKLWLENDSNGKRANLSDADLSGANLRYANLRNADLSGANLRNANLSDANLSDADLSDANLRNANLRNANLSDANLSDANLSDANLSDANLYGANLRYANLRYANLSDADLSDANLRNANLSDANLSDAKGLISTINFMEAHFERVPDGYIAYKTFNSMYAAPVNWEIKPFSVIEENVNFNRTNDCGCGINVAPLDWVKANYKDEIWKVLIRWEWLCGVCVPYQSDGKIRCERVELLGVVKR